MKSIHIIKINALGGIFTPLKLKSIVEIAFKAGVTDINFGPRQEIFLNVMAEKLSDFVEEMVLNNFELEVDVIKFPNIVSSYPAEGLFSADGWVTEGIYKDIFDQFDYTPRLKINICDKNQSLIPLFTGEINFVASETYQYWYLYLNFAEQKQLVRWDKLIYSTDIAKICREIEELYVNNKKTEFANIIILVNENTNFLSKEIDKELELARYVFPYYEGMSKYGNKFWLGLYRRDYMFPIPFIHALCQLCIQTNISQLCTTTWRTLILKGIEQKDRVSWEQILGKYGINLRHSSTELNWVVDDINSKELDLKKYIISQFDVKDVRTFGLVFGINVNNAPTIPASVIIVVKSFFSKHELSFFSNFDIYFAEDFNPNNPIKKLFAENISKFHITQNLLILCKKYYASLNQSETSTIINSPKPEKTSPTTFVYQCKHCYTIYDEILGEEFSNIHPNTLFETLPDTYKCSVCDAEKSDFNKILIGDLELANG